jgi:dTDP-4-amino-4,6-dideoxygalactose transaminase
MKVPLLDLTRQYEIIKDELESEVLKVLRGGHYILGPNVEAFENEAARYVGTKFAIGLNSGTDALLFALRALGIGPGDEVITTAFSYFATCEVINMVGATPVFCDIEYGTFNLDPADLKKKITKNTKAVMPVHIFGQLCDMKSLLEITRGRGIFIIEDACQAIGATSQIGNSGGIGDIGAFSFFPSKNLGAAGDGGLLTTNDEKIAATARCLRMHGTKSDRYRHEILGYNSRLDEIQAAVLRVKLRHLDDFIDKRRANAKAYDNAFSQTPGIVIPEETSGNKHTYHQYTLRIKNGKRDFLFDALKNAGVGSAIYYKVPLYRQPAYNGKYDSVSLPVTEASAEEVISLPIFPELTMEERCAVIAAVSQVLS